MADKKTGRLRHFREIAVVPLWRLGAYLLVEVVGTALTWRDLLVSPANQQRWGLSVLPHWDWGWWALGSAVVVIATLFEQSYRTRRKTESERDEALASVDDVRVREVEAREHHNRLLERQSAFDPIINAVRARAERPAQGLYDEALVHWIPLATLPFAVPQQEQFEGLDGVWPRWFYDIHLCDGNTQAPSRDPTMSFDPANPQFQDIAGNELVVCRVDWDRSRFEWKWSKNLIPSHRIGLSCEPWNLDALGNYGYLSPEVVERLTQKARFVWSVLRYPIQSLLDAGRIKLWGRKGSVTAPYSAVAADMWPHYEVVDWEAGRAQAQGGELLFSVRAEFVPAASIEPQ